ncbi:neuromedin-U [Puma concolor]|uniref:Neuromedin-U n=1 Tax=Puma concolor TaxID=9696 RepID=A0A6P6HR70_PUMCO|nr:neuromedin-U [Puma concolor]
MPRAASRRPGPPAGQVAAASGPLLLLLLACCAGTCLGAPILSQGLRPEQELQLWNEIDDACSSFLSLDSQPQASNALEELCITIRRTLPKPQEEFQGPIASQVRRQFLFRPRNGRRSEGYI